MAWENLNPIEITLRSSAAADSSAVLRRAAQCTGNPQNVQKPKHTVFPIFLAGNHLIMIK